MAAKSFFDGFELHRHLGSRNIPCSWCGTNVPLPAGDFSGVCIECGTVIFRPSRQQPRQESGLAMNDGYAPAKAV